MIWRLEKKDEMLSEDLVSYLFKQLSRSIEMRDMKQDWTGIAYLTLISPN